MDSIERQLLAGEVDGLIRALEEERYRHVAGLEPRPSLETTFQRYHRAAHRESAAELRAQGDAALAERIAALRAERAAAADEEAWRAAEVAARGVGPDGPLSLEAAALASSREPDPGRRAAFARAELEAFSAAAPARERWAEARARARAEVGLLSDWEQVIAADALLAATDDAYADVLGWLARREGAAAPRPHGSLDRAGLLQLLALAPLDGLFRGAALSQAVAVTAAALRLDLGRVRVDDAARAHQWPGAHVFGDRVAFRRRGGAADWLDLWDALGRALANAVGPPPHARSGAFAAAVGAVLSALLLDRAFLVRRLDVEKKHAPDVARALALRQLFRLRASAAALRVAVEVERGTSGGTWRAGHREALALAALASWPDGLHARDADPAPHAAALSGAALGARVSRMLLERYDEDWWRNPRAAEAIAGMLAAGGAPFAEGAALSEGAEPLVAALR